MWSEQAHKLRLNDDEEVPILHPEMKSHKIDSQLKHSENPPFRELTGFGIGFAGFFGEILISHPFVVLRRQCQARSSAQYLHFLPLSLIPVTKMLIYNQGVKTLWKGLTSSFVVHGLVIGMESLVSEFYSLPREITRHTSTKRTILHLLLKIVSWSFVAPVYAEHIVDSVQTDIASEESSLFSCIQGGLRRFWIPRNILKPRENKSLANIKTSIRDKLSLTTSRLLPYWIIVGPIVFLNVGYYIIRGLATMFIHNYYNIDGDYDQPSSLREQFSTRDDNTFHDQVRNNREQMALQETYMKYYNDLWVSMCSSLVSDILLFPIETIVVRICVQGTRTLIDNLDNGESVLPIVSSYENYIDVINEAFRSEFGILSLYKGFGSLLIQYSIQALFLYSLKKIFEHILLQYSNSPSRPYQSHPLRQDINKSHLESTNDDTLKLF